MTTLSKILCVLIILLLCFSFRDSLHEDGNQQSSGDFVSTAKATEYGDVMKKIIGGRKLMMMTNGEEEEETTLKRGAGETERNSSKSVEEDGLVAYTADYWRAKHHPPKNN
ncbi:PREDICTED: root meristem growth factor 3-like isoform X1 [Camelina sativa]|uniref:Root meristem growth factor 3-like isoform X1 n=1 Tax=Camelina sativa TaxID=90675 RepID=A0ABM0YKJ1_CAMSA|nr:PREDICTED: root meristem growth factor 3-like isoform X1 [Camelina sativa]